MTKSKYCLLLGVAMVKLPEGTFLFSDEEIAYRDLGARETETVASLRDVKTLSRFLRWARDRVSGVDSGTPGEARPLTRREVQVLTGLWYAV